MANDNQFSNSSLETQTALANARRKQLEAMYGKNPHMWGAAGGATMLGSTILNAQTEHNNLTRKIESIERRQDEISARADISIANIMDKGKKVMASQEAAFVKSGVKLEGSALNVVAETAEKAIEAARIRQREADFELGSQDVAKAIMKSKRKYIATNTALSAISTGIGAYGAYSATKQPTNKSNKEEYNQLMKALEGPDDFARREVDTPSFLLGDDEIRRTV